MNKFFRNLLKKNKFKQRQNNIGFEDDNHSYKTTGKPCSCVNCSPGKVEEKAKYRFNKFNKKDIE